MNLSENRDQREYETVLPLVNIVFLLLIFFMLAGSFNKVDFFAVTPPHATGKNAADLTQITIIMNADGEFAIEDQHYSKTTLTAYIKQHINQQSQQNSPTKTVVQLKADQAVKSQDLIHIMESLSATGLTSIRLLTRTNPTTDLP